MCKRGEIYYVKLVKQDPTSSIQSGIRPIVIVQNNYGNRFSPTIIAVPLTTSLKKIHQPTHVIIEASRPGLSRTSMVLAEQVLTVNKVDITGDLIHTLSEEKMVEIDEALMVSLSIGTEQVTVDENYIISMLNDIRTLESNIRAATSDSKLRLEGERQGTLRALKRYCSKHKVDYRSYIDRVQSINTSRRKVAV